MRGLLASAQPAAAVLLCTTYQFLVSMLLMSLLTGVMTNALMRVSAAALGYTSSCDDERALLTVLPCLRPLLLALARPFLVGPVWCCWNSTLAVLPYRMST